QGEGSLHHLPARGDHRLEVDGEPVPLRLLGVEDRPAPAGAEAPEALGGPHPEPPQLDQRGGERPGTAAGGLPATHPDAALLDGRDVHPPDGGGGRGLPGDGGVPPGARTVSAVRELLAGRDLFGRWAPAPAAIPPPRGRATAKVPYSPQVT